MCISGVRTHLEGIYFKVSAVVLSAEPSVSPSKQWTTELPLDFIHMSIVVHSMVPVVNC
jgi:hypothetical protein